MLEVQGEVLVGFMLHTITFSWSQFFLKNVLLGKTTVSVQSIQYENGKFYYEPKGTCKEKNEKNKKLHFFLQIIVWWKSAERHPIH